MSELDLEHGDPELADASPSARRRAARQMARDTAKTGTSKPAAKSSSSSSDTKTDGQLSAQLDDVFDKIVEALVARDDHELADAIREDKAVMAKAILSLTNTVKWLRSPLVIILGLIQPVLAFGRVARIVGRRWLERRARREAEHATEQANGNSPYDSQQAQAGMFG